MPNQRSFLIVACAIALVSGPLLGQAGAAGTAANLGQRVIIELKSDGGSQQAVQNVLREERVQIVHSLSGDDAVVVTLSQRQQERLEQADLVQSVYPDVEVAALRHKDQGSNGGFQAIPWNITAVQAPPAWPTTEALGVRVAVIDTGIDLDHPDLQGSIAGGTNIVDPRRSADDDAGHGSHVAGIIAAGHNAIGVVGVAPRASLYAVKVLDRRGRGYLSDVIAGLEWAIAQDIDVINLSLGTSVDIPLLHEAVQDARAAGILVVAAAGNDGGAVSYPAAYDEVMAVGMTDDRNEVSRYSARGAALDLVAPGVKVESTYQRGRYKRMTGTSMAAPHVTGLAALLIAQRTACDTNGSGTCDPTEVQRRLENTATDLAPAGRDDVAGYGLINARAALGL
ncbi:S8 family peptidase [Candidatus Berkelbacteria bacterium]|nr:S8 family peptidase [Candidatus Berkelbacteria bacterium]